MTMIHIYSNATADSGLANVYDASEHASGHAGHSYIGVGDIAGLEHTFRAILNGGVRLDEMDFHTHGGPGAIFFGAQPIGSNDLTRFRNQGFERIFKTSAGITFNGCNVAEEAQGELFIAEWGALFLRQGGGRVRGSTGLGLADPLFSGDVYHPFGQWVIANVSVGGAVSLSNHSHLHPNLIRNEISRLQRSIVQEDIVQQHNASILPAESTTLNSARVELREATSRVGPATSAPPYVDIYWAYVYTHNASQKIGTVLGSIRNRRLIEERPDRRGRYLL